MSLVFDLSFEPRHGEAVDVAAGVRRVTAPNVGPFTFQGTNTFLIGGTELAVLDPGPADERHLEAVLGAIGSARVAHILLSHGHQDHSGAARILQARTGAPILGALANQPLSTPPDEGSRVASDAIVLVAPDVVLVDGAVVAAGGLRLEAISTPGHASDHLAFALTGRGLLFSGDHVMGWSTTVVAPPDGSMADYMRSLDRLLARPERLYMPAHGGPIRDAHPYLRALRGAPSHARARRPGRACRGRPHRPRAGRANL
jgi:glyoxylase-like metal-dependent hydrolase (beta-lactamase superfamily II)